MSIKRQAFLLPLAFGPVVGIEAFCEVYMTDAQAAATLFPGVAMEKQTVSLSKDEKKRIEERSGERVRWEDVTYFKGSAGQMMYVDRVLGKHEYITYAVGLDAKGAVAGIEILDYRESYGHEIKRANWRAQFTGKDLQSPLEFEKDIKNISGATLSSAHVTRGVKRVLETHATLRPRVDAGATASGNAGQDTATRAGS